VACGLQQASRVVGAVRHGAAMIRVPRGIGIMPA
jgi:hypothetical protein